MTDVKQAATIFGEVYRTAKGKDGLETLLKETQQEFFDAVTAYWEANPYKLANRIVRKEDYNAAYHPGWREIDTSRMVRHQMMGEAVLEEDPVVKSWADIIDGYVYKRGVTHKEDTLDDERLMAEDSELWDEVSYWPQYDEVFDVMLWAFTVVCNPDPSRLAAEETERYLIEKPKTMRPPEEWTDKQAARLQKYIIPGAVSPRLVPPRKAKKHELETGEIDE